jgi:hypothetical protein
MNKCDQKQDACVVDWNNIQGFYEKEGGFKTSLTAIGNISGAVPQNTEEGSIYGAEFMPAIMHTPYYDRMTTETVSVPWLAESNEQTFMNRTKELNEPIVKDYRELVTRSIPQEQYASVEDFSTDTPNYYFKVLCIVFLVFIIYLIIKEMK